MLNPGTMLNPRTILVPTDFSASARNAYLVARDLAQRYDADVHVLHVMPSVGQFASLARWLTERSGSMAPDLREEEESRVEDELVKYFGDYERVQYVRRQGARASKEILDYAEQEEVDLIVIGTYGHRGLEHPALGGTAGDVVRKAPCPVLTVRAVDEEVRPFDGFRRLVVAVDFAEGTRELVTAAKELAAAYDASVCLLFVSEEHRVPLFSDTGMMTVTTLKLDEEIVAHADEALRQLDEQTGGPGSAYAVRHGNPAREIVDFAEADADDLIVVGRRGHSVHEGLLLGTVTEHVVRRSRRPVLILTAQEGPRS